MHSLVLGVGDAAFRDRAIGPEVVRRLQRCDLPGVAFVVAGDWDEVRLDELRGVDRLVVVAAVTNGGVPGRVQMVILEPPRSVAPRVLGLVLDPLVQLLAMVGLPRRLVVYTVAAGDVSAGVGLTAPVAAVLDRLVARVAWEVGGRTGVRVRG